MVWLHTRWRCLAMLALMTLASSTIAAAGEPGRPAPVLSSAASGAPAPTLAPGPLEEFVFFDRPSGYNRILMAMRWKAENLR